MTYSSRFWLYAPLALFCALAIGAMTHWWIIAGAFDRKLNALKGHDAIPGITVTYDSKVISGFPFRLDVAFTNLAIQGKGAHGAFAWHSEKFVMHSLAYGRNQDIFEAAGQQVLSWTDANGTAHRLQFLPGLLRASAIADARGLARFDLETTAASGTDTNGAAFTAGHGEAHLRRDPDGHDLDLMLSADRIKSANDITPLFGDEVRMLRFYVTLTKASAFAPLLQGTGAWPDAAAAWRAQGGTAKIGPVQITSSKVNFSAATAATDELGALTDPFY